MANEGQKRMLVIITNPFAALNVVHSGLLAQLARHFEIQILTNLFGKEELRAINTHFATKLTLASMDLPQESSFLNFLRKLEKALFFQHFDIETERIRALSIGGLWPMCYRFLTKVFRWIHVDTVLLRCTRNWIISISGRSEKEKGHSLNQFAAILSTSPLDIRESIVVNRSKRAVPSIAMIISWDNLTSKGLINANHDLVLVWNEIMTEEYLHFYKPFRISNTAVQPVGIARFDTHFRTERNQQNRCSFQKSFDLEAHDRVILFATSAPKHFPSQSEILKHLIAYAEQAANVKIMVRVHAFDDLTHYQIFSDHPNIRFSLPETLKADGMPGIPAMETLSSLSFILKNVQVCIHVASTIQLDAAACGTPVISIAYDGDSVLPYSKSVRRFYDYSHQQKIRHEAWGKMAYSREELYLSLNQLLNEPEIDTQMNNERLRTFTHFTEPQSVETITKRIVGWLG